MTYETDEQRDMTGFKGERPGCSLRGLNKTEIESTDSIETFASLQSRKVSLHFIYYRKWEKKQKNCHNLNLLLLLGLFAYRFPLGPHNTKCGPANTSFLYDCFAFKQTNVHLLLTNIFILHCGKNVIGLYEILNIKIRNKIWIYLLERQRLEEEKCKISWSSQGGGMKDTFQRSVLEAG
jgi:hypothetical protein